MAYRLEHLLAKKGSEDRCSLRTAARTEAPTLAGQGHQKLVVALIAEDARKACFVKSAIEVPVHDVIDKPAPKSINPLETLLPQPLYLLEAEDRPAGGTALVSKCRSSSLGS
jgi:hypothetical protein